LQELVEDVHLGGITIDAENKHVYWTAAWQSHNINDPGKKTGKFIWQTHGT